MYLKSLRFKFIIDLVKCYILTLRFPISRLNLSISFIQFLLSYSLSSNSRVNFPFKDLLEIISVVQRMHYVCVSISSPSWHWAKNRCRDWCSVKHCIEFPGASQPSNIITASSFLVLVKTEHWNTDGCCNFAAACFRVRHIFRTGGDHGEIVRARNLGWSLEFSIGNPWSCALDYSNPINRILIAFPICLVMSLLRNSVIKMRFFSCWSFPSGFRSVHKTACRALSFSFPPSNIPLPKKKDGKFHEVRLWKMYWICARKGVGQSASGRALWGCLATPRVWRSCRCGPGEWGAGGRVLCRKMNEGDVEHRQGKTRWMIMRMRRLFTCDAPSSWATECAVMCSWSKVCCAHAQVSVSVYRISV